MTWSAVAQHCMNERSIIGISALAIIVVGMVVYRVIWFIGREKRRNSGFVWFRTRDPK